MKKSQLKEIIKAIIKESGEWRGWGNVTSVDKEEFKKEMLKIREHYLNFYSKQLSSTKVFLIDKILNNLDNTDPTDAAKPLARFSMEDRLFISDSIRSTAASKVFDKLYRIAYDHIEGYKPHKNDIVIDKLATIQYRSGRTEKRDVGIDGVEDNRPILDLGDGGRYQLTKKFVEQFSKPGAKIEIYDGAVVINMEEVMEKVIPYLGNFHDDPDLPDLHF